MNIKRITITFLFLCFNIHSHGTDWTIGARSAGIGNASVTLTDVWSIQNNQAGLAYLEGFSAGCSYMNYFGMKEFSLKSVALVFPVAGNVLGVSATRFGDISYSESKAGLAFARKFGSKFSAGVQLDVASTHFAEDYGDAVKIIGELGFRYSLNTKFIIAGHISNPAHSRYNKDAVDRIPTVFKLGLAYQCSDKLSIFAETEKDLEFDPLMKAGFEYHAGQRFWFRSGISTRPLRNMFGFGIKCGDFIFDFATAYHMVLGFTPSVSIVFSKSQ